MLIFAGLAFAHRTWKAHEFFQPELLFSRFPAEDAIALSVDFAALRKAGLLAESKSRPEPDYQAFVDGTGFDYRRDLDLLAASFSGSGNYFIARGRFDFEKLRDYAARQGGACFEALCRAPGSRPERHISFLPLRSDTLALAVAADDLAAARLANPGTPVTAKLPGSPVWFIAPGAVLRKPDAMPAGLRMMVSSLANVDRVVVTVGPGSSGIVAQLETASRSADEAGVLTSQLQATTAAIRNDLPRDGKSGDELARALAAGTFRQSGTRVTGAWPVSRALIDSLTTGM